MPHDDDPSALSAELEAAALREIARAWHHVNGNAFRFALRPPLFELRDGEQRLGHWSPAHRTIALSRRLVFGEPWGSVLEVLKHEMAHQYAHEVLGAVDEVAHGPAFRSVCERMGIDAASAGVPAPGEAEGSAEARVLQRVAHLLALAESQNVHEAEAAMKAARRLMLRHNLDAASAARAPSRYAFRHLGRPTGRIQEHERVLAGILAEHFFVEAIWVPAYRPAEGKRGSVLEVCGSPTNLELAAYVYDFVRSSAEACWQQHKRERKLASNAERGAFLAGLTRGFDEKLREGQRESAREGLVWVGDPQLGAYFRRRHPYVRHVRYQGKGPSEAFAQGREQGRKLVLHRPVSAGPSGSTPLLTK
ncbi:MAG TPA: DUF2786 domain-containing protein [Polyangiaceae bacterium]|nr:DUF2786 domain-containing protein [Polyangiaceae bacterium]